MQRQEGSCMHLAMHAIPKEHSQGMPDLPPQHVHILCLIPQPPGDMPWQSCTRRCGPQHMQADRMSAVASRKNHRPHWQAWVRGTAAVSHKNCTTDIKCGEWKQGLTCGMQTLLLVRSNKCAQRQETASRDCQSGRPSGVRGTLQCRSHTVATELTPPAEQRTVHMRRQGPPTCTTHAQHITAQAWIEMRTELYPACMACTTRKRLQSSAAVACQHNQTRCRQGLCM